MRWLFAETDEELEERARVVDRIDAWWRSFADHADDIGGIFSGQSEIDLPQFMQDHLQSIEPGLMWEFGPGVGRPGHRLVVTPESEHRLGPLVDTLIERAPEIHGWQFFKYRLPENTEDTAAMVQARAAVDISGWRVLPQCNGKKIDLRFLVPGLADAEADAMNLAVMVAADSILGEDIVNRWIGGIGVEKPKRRFLGFGRDAAAGSSELKQLKRICDDLVAQIRSELPGVPYCDLDDAQTGFLYELEPREADDYPEMSDMFVGKATIPGFFEAVRSGPFHSSSFSRCGETFCYVKLDGKDGLDEERFADKSEIEDALDSALRTAQCGCVIGGGTGLRYSYIDLAVTEVPRAVDAMRRVLREGSVPKRSWILFFDSELADEWLGIYEDTPAPPTPN